jgi:hypothetical protein
MEPRRPRRVEAERREGAPTPFKRCPENDRRYFELLLRVLVVTRSSPVSFGSPMASTSLPV